MNILLKRAPISLRHVTATQMFHMHASRPGPALSNEIILSIKEHEANPNLEKIIGVQQPSGTVGKFVSYWLGGLPDGVKQQIIANVYGELKGAGLVERLCQQADAVRLSPTTFIDHFFLPIYEAYENEMNAVGIVDATLQKVRSLETTHSFSNVMIQCSLALVNAALAHRGYPSIDIIPVRKDLYEKYQATRSVDLKLLHHLALNKMEQRYTQYHHAFDSIAKDLKAYRRCPNGQQLDNLLTRFESNKSHRGIFVSAEDLVAFYDHGETKDIQFDDYLACVESAYKASITAKAGHVGYITGEEMVKVIFEMAAESDNTYLATQKFMRGFDYSLYDKLHMDYPGLCVQPSAFTTWDTSVFPEFDTNFACGLKYLIESR